MIRVLLIETSPQHSSGSMPRYASLLEEALQGDPNFDVKRIVVAPLSVTLQGIPRRLRTAAHHATIAWNTAQIQGSQPADIYHIVDGSHGYIANWLPSRKTVVTAHDIIPELQVRGCFPLPPPGRAARWLIRASLRGVGRVAHAIAVSDATANDLVKYGDVVRERISVVPHALPSGFVVDSIPATCRDGSGSSSSPPFLFHIGNNGFYKNRMGVVRIFARVRQHLSVRLRLAGPSPHPDLIALIRELDLQGEVDFVIDPDDRAVLEMYRSARLLLFPSLYEGFGWPPLEAMANGCPVVCSLQGSLPEVVGSAALLADATDEAKLAEHCLSILRDPSVAEQLAFAGRSRAAEFSLQRFRNGVLDVYRSVYDAHRRHFARHHEPG